MNIKHLLIVPDKNNIEESVRLAKEYGCGFEYQDFFFPSMLDDIENRNNLISTYQNLEYKTEYNTLHGAFFDVTIFSDDERIYEVSDLRVVQSLSIASKLGANAVVFHTNYTPNFMSESYRSNWVERNASYWIEKLEEYPNLSIYIENMFDTDWELLTALAVRMDMYDRFGVCFDYAHAHVFGDEKRMEEWVKNLAPYVKHIHINDNDYRSDLHLPLGAGRIKWKRFKQYYEKYFSHASVLVEMTGVENIEASLQLLQSL